MTPPDNLDPTPEVGSQADVAPLGRSQQKPAHERTAEEERDFADWDAIAASAAFRALLVRKTRFIVAGTVFFLVYYFALPVLVGWFPELMERRVGPMNWAYLFALSQFFMAWIVAAVYVKVAAKWDRDSQAIIQHTEGR